MRVSTANQHDQSVANLQRRQREMLDSQQQMTTLKRVNRASDDPTAAARAERALALQARSTASQRAVEASKNAMQLTESTLGDASELLQQARETLVAAGNASYSDAERISLAKALRAQRTQLLTLANRGDGSGGYLFAGQGSSNPPFVDAPGGVQFRGVTGQIGVGSDEPLALTLDGQATWTASLTGNGVFETRATTQTGTAWIDAGRVSNPGALTGDPYSLTFSVTGTAPNTTTTFSVLRNGNPTALTNVTYESGRAIEIDGQSFNISGTPANGDRFDIVPSTPTLNVFDMLERAAVALETPLRNGGQITQTATLALRDIDQSMGRIFAQRSQAGETLQRIASADDRLESVKLQAQTERSQAEDLDMTEAVSNFQLQQTSYEVALKSYASVQKLSLFQYLNL
jgi:flagellar hook-associated protein 3 FlgL